MVRGRLGVALFGCSGTVSSVEPTWSTDAAQRYGEELMTGVRVRLRGLRDDDLPRLAGWWQDPVVEALQMTWVNPPSETAARDLFARWSTNQDTGVGFSIETLPDGDRPSRLIGHLVLFNVSAKNRSATYAIGLGPADVGRGFGTDATRLAVRYGFREMGLHRIELQALAFNDRALAAYRRAGFVLEGRRRDAVFHDGRWHDQMLMAVLHSDPIPPTTPEQ